MYDLLEESRPVKAYVIADNNDEASLKELCGLVDTLGMECCGTLLLGEIKPSIEFFVGSGKANEIKEMAKSCDAECIIFDFAISPTQQRNWEHLTKINCFDRQEVILRIFDSRAKTKEASLQVELAKLQYSLPRLAHSYGEMSRQRGGNYGSKGAGETKLELDKRQVQEKISQIKKNLEKVRQSRCTMRKKREKIPLPVCAIVGYTNAGKSSLLNALTDSDVYAKDELFATLDPSTRRYEKDGKFPILFGDTVGFIKKLPHTLIDAFRSTLEEVASANILIIVLDGTSEFIQSECETTLNVLNEISAIKSRRIFAINKVDLIDENRKYQLQGMFPKSQYDNLVYISTKTGEGLDELVENVYKLCFDKTNRYLVPYERGDILALFHRECYIIEENNNDNGVCFEAKVPREIESNLIDFIYKK